MTVSYNQFGINNYLFKKNSLKHSGLNMLALVYTLNTNIQVWLVIKLVFSHFAEWIRPVTH